VPRVRSNGIELEVESFGADGAPVVLLITGLSAQLVRWDERFCAGLVERGLRVLRFDNRDAGLSTKLDGAGPRDVARAIGAALRGEPVEPAYRLEDMADDAAGLLDALGVESVHVAGTSLGGMVAQLLAIRHPSRVRSLVSIMSTTGDRSLPGPTAAATRILMTPAPAEREAHLAHQVEATRTLQGGGLPFDEAHARRRAAREYDRCYHPAGAARQLLANLTQTSRRRALRELRVPTLVIHGDHDPLVRLEAGVDTHQCVPGSRLHVVRGMGHDLAPALWPEIIDAIAGHAGAPPSGREAHPTRR
jgi:pimeloyl-ACP methyl ester carboxylesterase